MRNIELSDVEGKIKEMFFASCNVREKAYAPHSGYQVGAAVLDSKHNIHVGCNTENAIFLAGHAEGNAINTMIANAGSGKIKALVCVTANMGTCCGLCRQLIWEHCHNDNKVPIYCFNLKGSGMEFTIGELLPYAFKLEQPSKTQNA